MSTTIIVHGGSNRNWTTNDCSNAINTFTRQDQIKLGFRGLMAKVKNSWEEGVGRLQPHNKHGLSVRVVGCSEYVALECLVRSIDD